MRWPPHRLASRCSDLACKAFVRQEVSAIWQDIDNDSCVADRNDIDETLAWLGIDVQSKDSLVIGSESELAGGAKHSFRQCAADLSLLELETTRQHSPNRRERIEASLLD